MQLNLRAAARAAAPRLHVEEEWSPKTSSSVSTVLFVRRPDTPPSSGSAVVVWHVGHVILA